MIYNYNEFISESLINKFDKKTFDGILALNSCKDFRDRGITLSEIDISKNSNYSIGLGNIIEPLKNLYKDNKNPIKLFKVEYSKGVKNVHYLSRYVNTIGIKQFEDGFISSKYTGSSAEDLREIPSTDDKETSEEAIKSMKDTIIHYFKISENIYKNQIRVREEAEKERAEREKQFKKIDKQFITDQFSGAFDLCDQYHITEVSPGIKIIDVILKFKTTPSKEGKTVSVSSHYGDRFPTDRTFYQTYGRLDSTMCDIMLELSEISARLNDHKIETYVIFTDDGLCVRLDTSKIK